MTITYALLILATMGLGAFSILEFAMITTSALVIRAIHSHRMAVSSPPYHATTATLAHRTFAHLV
jgi:hypothetical protein